MTVTLDSSLEGIDWVQAKADLAADAFDSGRTPDAPRRSFDEVQHVAFARVQVDDGDGARAFYASLGFTPQPEFWSTVVGRWLENDANR